MRRAPSFIAWSRKALNLISALHSTSGLGVRPAEYSARKALNTRSLYSPEKFTTSRSMPIVSATDAQSTRSSRVEQYSSSSSSSQFFMKRPTTSWPARLRSSAATDESTPPDMPTTIFSAMGGLRRAALVLPDELRHARDALLDRGVGGRVREADVLAFAGNARAEVDVGEHGDVGLVEQALAKLLGVSRAYHAAGLGYVGPGVEGAARGLAEDARHLVQQPNDQVAAREEGITHLPSVVLRTVDRLHRGPLADMRGAGVGVRHPAHELRREQGIGGESDPPPGHRPGLGGAVGDDRTLVHSRQRRDRAELALVAQPRVDLVGVNPDVGMT